MAKQVVECFFCKENVDLNGHHFTIKGPDEKIHMVHEHTGVREHGGVEVNAPEKAGVRFSHGSIIYCNLMY